MAGANYVGGRGTAVKNRFQDKTATRTKQHFAKKQLSTIHPVSRLGGLPPRIRPVFVFDHARRHLQDSHPESGSALQPPARGASAVSRLPRKQPVSAAMQKIELEEPISFGYKKRQLLKDDDFAGLKSKRQRLVDTQKSLYVLTAPPALDASLEVEPAPFPSIEPLSPTLTSPATSQLTSKGSFCPLTAAFQTPRRPNSARAPPRGPRYRLPLVSEQYHSASDPNSDDEDHEGDVATFSEALEHIVPVTNESHNTEHEPHNISALELSNDPWEALAAQMGIELSPPDRNATHPLSLLAGFEDLPYGERTGVDHRIALFANDCGKDISAGIDLQPASSQVVRPANFSPPRTPAWQQHRAPDVVVCMPPENYFADSSPSGPLDRNFARLVKPKSFKLLNHCEPVASIFDQLDAQMQSWSIPGIEQAEHALQTTLEDVDEQELDYELLMMLGGMEDMEPENDDVFGDDQLPFNYGTDMTFAPPHPNYIQAEAPQWNDSGATVPYSTTPDGGPASPNNPVPRVAAVPPSSHLFISDTDPDTIEVSPDNVEARPSEDAPLMLPTTYNVSETATASELVHAPRTEPLQRSNGRLLGPDLFSNTVGEEEED